MAVTIRSLSPTEWRTYRSVRLAALQDAPETFGGTHAAAAAYPDEQWIAWCSQPSWFAFVGTRPVGMVRTFPVTTSQLPELISMWVTPEARGTGAADLLVGAVLDWAHSEGHPGVSLHVMQANHRAIRFYERLGFVTTGASDSLSDGRIEIELVHPFGAAPRP